MMSVFSSLESQRPEFKNALKTWETRLAPKLQEMETERTRVIKAATQRTIMTALIAIVVVAVILILTGGAMGGFIMFAGGIIAVASAGIAWLPLSTMQSKTKQHIVGAAADAFGFEYHTLHDNIEGVDSWKSAGEWLKSQSDPGNAMRVLSGKSDDADAPTPAFDVLREAGLLPSYDDVKFEDFIGGDRAEAEFSMVECKLTEEQGSGKNRRTVTKFQGLLFHIQYPDRFLGKTLIARQGWWKGWFGKNSDLQKVDMVSRELEDQFTIYSNDQVEARALLTPDRMERLIALERHFKGGKLRGVFEGDHLTLALQAKNQFEAGSIWKTLEDPKRYIDTLTEIGLVCDVIDGFLTREWVKDKL